MNNKSDNHFLSEEYTLKCTCPIGEEDANCPEHQRLRKIEKQEKSKDKK